MIKTNETLGVQAAKGAAWTSVEMLGSQLSSFVVFVVMSHYLSPKDFGIIGIAFLVIQSVQTSILNNITTPIAKEQFPGEEEFDTTFWLAIIVSLFCYLVTVCLIYICSKIFQNSVLFQTLYSMSPVLIFYGLSKTHETWFVRFFHFKILAFRGVFASILSGGIGVYLAANGYGLIAIVVQQILMLVIGFMLMYLSCPWKPSFRFSKVYGKKILSFNKSILPSSIINTLNQSLDSIFVSSIFGLTTMGYYTVAKRIRLAAQLICFSPIKGVILSSLAEIQNDEERLKRNFINGLLVLSSILIPVFTLLSLTSESLILILFGKIWLPSATLLSFLALAGLLNTLIFYIENLFIIKSKPELNNVSSFGYTAGVLFFVFILPASTFNIGLSFLIPYILLFPIVLIMACNLLRLQIKVVFVSLFQLVLSTLVITIIAFFFLKLHFFKSDMSSLVLLALTLPFIYYKAFKVLAPTSFDAIQKILMPMYSKFLAKKIHF